MNYYLITFVTIDGNIESVRVFAHTQTEALQTFADQYEFDELMYIS